MTWRKVKRLKPHCFKSLAKTDVTMKGEAETETEAVDFLFCFLKPFRRQVILIPENEVMIAKASRSERRSFEGFAEPGFAAFPKSLVSQPMRDQFHVQLWVLKCLCYYLEAGSTTNFPSLLTMAFAGERVPFMENCFF